MASFVVRRLIASVLVFLAATYHMYLLVAYSCDPLQDLIESNAPNKEQLIASRIRLLDLDVPPPLRYFLWMGRIFGLPFEPFGARHFFDLGVSVGVAVAPEDGRTVEALLSRSDKALYRAKENRGSYVFARDLRTPGPSSAAPSAAELAA